MTVAECITRGRERLANAAIQCADTTLHMKQILEHCLGLSTSDLYLRWDRPLSPEEERRVEAFVERRSRGEPFQYIAGYEWFWDARFRVGPGVLIPRKETEILVERLLAEESRDEVSVAELGPGSGNIGLIALRNRPRWKWRAFELNPDSLPYLEANRRELLPPEAGYVIRPGDFFELAGEGAPYDWIVSNPPYVGSGEFPSLAREIHHEPRLALDGGPAGLDVIRRLVEAAAGWLEPGGRILGEMAGEQGEVVAALLAENRFDDVRIGKDYGGLDRIFIGTWRGPSGG